MNLTDIKNKLDEIPKTNQKLQKGLNVNNAQLDDLEMQVDRKQPNGK